MQYHNLTSSYFLEHRVKDGFVLRQKVETVSRNGIFTSSCFGSCITFSKGSLSEGFFSYESVVPVQDKAVKVTSSSSEISYCEISKQASDQN